MTPDSQYGTRRFEARVRRECVGRVLDFGAGRGSWFSRPEQRAVRDLRGLAEVWACDIDQAVFNHPAADHRVVVDSRALPFANGAFDMILCDYVFEHLESPRNVARELVRVLRAGGLICARTANAWGYPALAARVVPNRLHRNILRRAQPERPQDDVFPTAYRLNRPAVVQRIFAECELEFYFDSAEPSYYFGHPAVYRVMSFVHRRLPQNLATGFCCFIRKH